MSTLHPSVVAECMGHVRNPDQKPHTEMFHDQMDQLGQASGRCVRFKAQASGAWVKAHEAIIW